MAHLSATLPAALAAQPSGERPLQHWLRLADPQGSELPAVACAAATEAAAQAAVQGLTIEHGRAVAWRCTHQLRQGLHAEVMRDAPLALPLLQGAELHVERCELLRVLTLSASEVGAFDVALDAAQELVALTATDGQDAPALSAAFALAACFERMGDSWQAGRLLSHALKQHGAVAGDLPTLVAANGLCAISIGTMHRMAGTGSDAERQRVLTRARVAGEQARALLARVVNPAYEVAVLGNLGEVMLHQGDLAGAEPLLRRSRELALERGLHAHGWRVQATWGEWLVESGRPDDALALMRGLLDEMGGDAPQQTAVRAHQVAYRANRRLGRFEAALVHLEEVERSERVRTTAQLRAQSKLFVTRTEAQQAQWQAEQARLDAQQQRERAAEFAASAECDPLTGLGNRRHLARRCAELLPQLQRDQRPLALAQIDIDHFKSINDRFGHAEGDRVLVTIAQLLRENMRRSDVVSRHGGEEFVLVLPGMALARAVEVCERLRVAVAQHCWTGAAGQTLQVTISIGLACAGAYELAPLLQQADEALYRAKRLGRNRLCTATAN